jgi:hypothetical protein
MLLPVLYRALNRKSFVLIIGNNIKLIRQPRLHYSYFWYGTDTVKLAPYQIDPCSTFANK